MTILGDPGHPMQQGKRSQHETGRQDSYHNLCLKKDQMMALRGWQNLICRASRRASTMLERFPKKPLVVTDADLLPPSPKFNRSGLCLTRQEEKRSPTAAMSRHLSYKTLHRQMIVLFPQLCHLKGTDQAMVRKGLPYENLGGTRGLPALVWYMPTLRSLECQSKSLNLPCSDRYWSQPR